MCCLVAIESLAMMLLILHFPDLSNLKVQSFSLEIEYHLARGVKACRIIQFLS